MSTFTEAQIREAIKEVVEAAAPLAVVFSWWCLRPDPNTWPGILTPTSGADSDKPHGYVITRRRTEPTGGGDDGRINVCRVRRLFNYDIIGIHYHDTGNEDANSDLKFNAELDAICDSFINKENFQDTALARSHVPEFAVDLRMLGGSLKHFALGSLVVEQC